MKKLALIFGGPSAEHDVSLVSAKNILQVLEEMPDIEVLPVGVTRKGVWKLIAPQNLKTTSFTDVINLDELGQVVEVVLKDQKAYLSSANSELYGPLDVAFPIIHGTYGEDGVLQRFLGEHKIKFVGTDSEACQNSFDKALTKKLLNGKGVSQVPYLSFDQQPPSWDGVQAQLGLPLFVKPSNMGSSIGISKVKNQADYETAILEARKHDVKVVIEKAIKARELECALLEGDQLQVSGLGEVIPKHEFYSYEAKYLDANGADIVIPASVEPEIAKKIQAMAKVCFQALGCRDYARADFFLDENNNIFFNEINTHPGFTSISQFPMLWEQEGLTYPNLIEHLVHRALQRTEPV